KARRRRAALDHPAAPAAGDRGGGVLVLRDEWRPREPWPRAGRHRGDHHDDPLGYGRDLHCPPYPGHPLTRRLVMNRNERHDAALARDAAGIGPHARPGIRLASLRELDHYRVAEGDADVRGWEVRTVGGREIGKVADMLVDPDAGEVVMLDVDL